MFEFKVSGMTCGGCVKSLTNALKAFDINSDINIDLDSQTVRIDTSKSKEEITSTILDAGYTVIDSKIIN